MSDYVYDGTSLPAGKVDVRPAGVPANKAVSAAEWNTAMASMDSLRSALLDGQYHGLDDFAAAVSVATKGRVRFKDGRFQVSEDGGDYRTLKHPDVNVLDFGADPTGVADSSPAFMAAIASFSGSSSSDAGRIIIPPGKYRLASTVRIKKNVWICGLHAGNKAWIFPDPGITAFKFERYNVSTDLGSGASDSSRLSNVQIYNPSHKVAVWQQSHAYTVGQRVKCGPAPGQGLKVFTDTNEYYRHYECTVAGTSAASGSGPVSKGQDKSLSHGSITGGSFTKNNEIVGATSGAFGFIVKDASGVLRLTSVSGTFQNGETLREYDSTGTLTGVTAPCVGTQSPATGDESDGSGALTWKYIGAGAGVHIRSNGVELVDVSIFTMSGAGLHIVANDLEDPGAFTNANGWQLFNCVVGGCDGHGLYLRGSDANGGTWFGGSCAGNGGPASDESFSGPGFNIYDTSFLGNTYVGVELYTVGGQGCIFTNSIGGGCAFLGCYQEGAGGGYNICTTKAVVVGGGLADSEWKSTGYATGHTHWNPANVVKIGTGGNYGLPHNIDGFGANPWRANTTIPQGITRTNAGNVYIAANEGTTSPASPPTGTGTGIVDGTVHWDFLAVADPGGGYAQLGSNDPNYKTVLCAQVPDFWGVGVGWLFMNEVNAGFQKNGRVQRYGISGPNASEGDGNGVGLMIAQNKTTINEWPMKIPAGKVAIDMMWLGGSRVWGTATAADPTFGIWNPGDRIYYKGAALTAGGPAGRRCVTGGSAKTYGGGRTATADGSAVIVLTGAVMGTLRDQQDFRVGDYVTVGGSATRHVTAVSDDGRTLTLDGTVSAGSGKAMVFVAPVFEEFGAAVTLTAVGSSPSANGATLSGAALTLQPADGTRPGVMTAGTQTIGGNKTLTGTLAASNLSGTNTGDVTMAAVGSSPSANGATLSGQVLTLQPADATHPGILSILAQVIAGAKTFSSTIISSVAGTVLSCAVLSQYIIDNLANAVHTGMWVDANNVNLNFDVGGNGTGSGTGGTVMQLKQNGNAVAKGAFVSNTADGGYLFQGGGATTFGLWMNAGVANFEVGGSVLMALSATWLDISGANAVRAKGLVLNSYTDGSGTTGAQTINKYRGKVKIAAGQTSIVVTNNTVDTNSHVNVMLETNDATAQIKNVTKASGSFTVNMVAAVTADTVLSFFICN